MKDGVVSKLVVSRQRLIRDRVTFRRKYSAIVKYHIINPNQFVV